MAQQTQFSREQMLNVGNLQPKPAQPAQPAPAEQANWRTRTTEFKERKNFFPFTCDPKKIFPGRDFSSLYGHRPGAKPVKETKSVV